MSRVAKCRQDIAKRTDPADHADSQIQLRIIVVQQRHYKVANPLAVEYVAGNDRR